jgi:glycosyltransferase involved in cell wall biosynthesis
MDRPLVSFIVNCYNQEAFVLEAVEGALSQKYSPLEIIISDDCSKDGTFDIARRLVASYKGPHKVILNHNRRNLGVGGNLSRAMELCRGELFVMAPGDDISLPDRTATVVEAWDHSGRKATSVHSLFSEIDQTGQPRCGYMKDRSLQNKSKFVHAKTAPLSFARTREPLVCGCTHAISRNLWSLFGSLPEGLAYEDTALSFRTVLAGGLFTFINAPLVEYRRHGSNVTFGLHEKRPQDLRTFHEVQTKRRLELKRFADLYHCFAMDAKHALHAGLISGEEYTPLDRLISLEGRRFELRSQLFAQPWPKRFSILCALYCRAIRPREFIENLPHFFPRALHRFGVIARNRIHSCTL